jgi:hypothetical protein
MSLKHIVSGLGVIVLGLLILSDEMLYDAYVMPPLENGAIITTPAAVNISGHMCFTHSYLNTCGNTMQCANAICNMSQQTINTSGFVMLMPIQCRLSSFGAMFEFPKYQATGIIMLITVGLLLLWILVFAGQSTLVRHNIPTRKSIQAVIRWIFLGLFVLTRLAVTGAVLSYTLFHNDYSILWWKDLLIMLRCLQCCWMAKKSLNFLF